MEKTYNFECNIEEHEKITITTKPNFLDDNIEIKGITLQNDTMVQMADLSENMQIYIWGETQKYFNQLKNS